MKGNLLKVFEGGGSGSLRAMVVWWFVNVLWTDISLISEALVDAT